jgi:soluble lytic murein transglycosylase-like protein
MAVARIGPPPGPTLDDLTEAADFDLETAVQETATRHGVDPTLLRSVVATESSGRAGAVSPKGAMGLMQLMPATATALGVTRPFSPRENLDAVT